MSPREWRARVNDILVCINNIHTFTLGMTFDDFITDLKSIRAVAYELITMGEAARAIPVEIQDRYPDIPWLMLRDIRNVLVHEYFRMDEEILWQTVNQDLPALVPLLQGMISTSNLQ